MRGVAALGLVIVAFLATASGAALPQAVEAIGLVQYSSGSSTCDAVAKFAAVAEASGGVLEVSGPCVLTFHWEFLLGQCHEFCGGQCDFNSSIVCWFGDSPDEARARAELLDSGEFTARLADGTTATGVLNAVWT